MVRNSGSGQLAIVTCGLPCCCSQTLAEAPTSCSECQNGSQGYQLRRHLEQGHKASLYGLGFSQHGCWVRGGESHVRHPPRLRSKKRGKGCLVIFWSSPGHHTVSLSLLSISYKATPVAKRGALDLTSWREECQRTHGLSQSTKSWLISYPKPSFLECSEESLSGKIQQQVAKFILETYLSIPHKFNE